MIAICQHTCNIFFFYHLKKEERIPSNLCFCARHVSNLVHLDGVIIGGEEYEEEGEEEEEEEE